MRRKQRLAAEVGLDKRDLQKRPTKETYKRDLKEGVPGGSSAWQLRWGLSRHSTSSRTSKTASRSCARAPPWSAFVGSSDTHTCTHSTSSLRSERSVPVVVWHASCEEEDTCVI